MTSRHRFLRLAGWLAAAALLVSACRPPAEPELTFIPYSQAVASSVVVDLDYDGEPEIVVLEQRPVVTPSGWSSITVNRTDMLSVGQENIPGQPVSVVAVPTAPLGIARAVGFVKRGDSLLARGIGLTNADGPRITVSPERLVLSRDRSVGKPAVDWDVYVTTGATYVEQPGTGRGMIVVSASAGHAGSPRALLALDARTLEPVWDRRMGPTPSPKVVYYPPDRPRLAIVGTFAPENGVSIDGIADNRSWVLGVRLDDGGLEWASPVGERMSSSQPMLKLGAAGQAAEVVVRMSTKIPPTMTIRRLDTRDGALGAEVFLAGDATEAIVANVLGSVEDEFVTLSAHRLEVRTADGTVLYSAGLEPAARSLSVTDVLGDALGEIVINDAGSTTILGGDLRPVAAAPFRMENVQRVGKAGDRLVEATVSSERKIYRLGAAPAAASPWRWSWIVLVLVSMSLGSGATWAWFRFRGRVESVPTDEREATRRWLFAAGDEPRSVLWERRLKEVLAASYSDPNLSVESLAAAVGDGSPRDLNRHLKQRADLTLRELIEGYRLERACEMLRAGEPTIEEISRLVGFRTPQYFTTRFGKSMGLTPSEYREKAIKRPK